MYIRWLTQVLFLQKVKTYEDMTLEELDENEDEFEEEDEAAIEMYRWVKITECDVGQVTAHLSHGVFRLDFFFLATKVGLQLTIIFDVDLSMHNFFQPVD